MIIIVMIVMGFVEMRRLIVNLTAYNDILADAKLFIVVVVVVENRRCSRVNIDR